MKNTKVFYQCCGKSFENVESIYTDPLGKRVLNFFKSVNKYYKIINCIRSEMFKKYGVLGVAVDQGRIHLS